MNGKRRRRARKGNIVVLTALLMVVLLAVVAFAVDLGYLYIVRDELQRNADASAMAAAWDLIDEQGPSDPNGIPTVEIDARATASQYSQLNQVDGLGAALELDDVVVGYLQDPSNPSAQLNPASLMAPNAVRVQVQKNDGINGRVPLFFARALGFEDVSLQAEATAALLNNIGGFRAPPGGGNLSFLPLALDEDTWNALLGGAGSDDWTWSEEDRAVVAGSDGILECNLYPQGTGSPGNRGTVDVGSNNNSTADLSRQIVSGVSADDLEHHGGTLELDEDGELGLNGDTGISAGIKDELESIKGLPRVIPVFSNVSGNGNNAQYTIVGFAGIRITEVKLTGQSSSKRVVIQPCNIVVHGAIPGPGTQTSYNVYSAVWLVR